MTQHLRQTRGARLAGDLGARARASLRRVNRAHAYPVFGAALALGMPIGLAIVRAAAAGQWPTLAGAMADVMSAPATYAYVTMTSTIALIGLGTLLGRWFDLSQRLGSLDPLTGLLNRRCFAERLAVEQSRAARSRERSCLLCLDVDRLKAINDLHGHLAGDRALITVAGVLARSVRPSDAIARFGGDEFVVLLYGSTTREAQLVARRILAELGRAAGGPGGRIDVSIGLSELSPSADADAAMALADAELYRAKGRGGRQIAGLGAPPVRARSYTLEQASRLVSFRALLDVAPQT